MQNNKIELLAPAGDEDAFLAAIASGANAIYFGLEHFSARTRAKNITVEQAKKLLPLAKRYNIKTYLTLNTLLLQSEIKKAVELAKIAVSFGLDAVIVQDLGLFYALKKEFPNLEFHASTQMTTHNLEQCKFLADLGFSQINLSRELSLKELKPLCDFLHSKNIVPEIFVHGAFCISFSGQCYFSGNFYGEEGNRGSCVQPCRRCYKIDEDFKNQSSLHTPQTPANIKNIKNSTNGEFLPFFLKDNNAFPLAKELAELSPISLKIEGRIKNAEYVFSLCTAWNKQLKQIKNGTALKTHPAIDGAINRGYSDDYLRGKISSQMFAIGEKDLSLKQIGNVENFFAKENILTLNNKSNFCLTNGTRILIKEKNNFVANAIIEKIEKIESLSPKTPKTQIEKNSKISAKIKIIGKLSKKIEKNQQIFANTSAISSEKLNTLIEKLKIEKENFSISEENEKLSSINVTLFGKAGTNLKAVFECEFGKSVQQSIEKLQIAKNTGLNEKTAFEKLSKLGGTGFKLCKINLDNLENSLYISPSTLNALRRAAVEELTNSKNKYFEKIGETADFEKSTLCDDFEDFNETVACGDFKEKSAIVACGGQTDFEKSVAVAGNGGRAKNADFSKIATNLKNKENKILKNTQKLPQNSKLAFVCSKIEIAKELLLQNKIAIFEIPLFISKECEDFVLNFNVIPYFSSILIGEHLETAKNLVKKLAQKNKSNFQNLPDLICGNLGLAHFSNSLGLKCLLDSNLNITNAFSSFILSQNANIFGFVPSFEISANQIETLKNGSAQNLQIWFPLFFNNLLMQSRQCLVKKATNCSKPFFDQNCIKNCEKSAFLIGTQGEKLLARKRANLYNALYKQNITYNGEIFYNFSPFVNCYLVDFRFLNELASNFEFSKVSHIAKKCEELLHYLIEENSTKIATTLKELETYFGKVTKPKYFFTECE